MTKISVIILCHDNNFIDCVINSVKKQVNPDDEIFVVDDNSSRSIKELIHSAGSDIQILLPKINGNRAHNRNYAAERSTGDFLVFIDGDVLLEDNVISRIRELNFTNTKGVCGNVAAMQIVPEEANIILKNFNNRIDWHCSQDFNLFHRIFPDSRKGMHELPWNRFYSAICIIPREVFFQAGSFDENLSEWGGEDIDLGYRLSLLGHLVFDDEIRGIHIPHLRNQYQNEITSRRNMYAMLAKYRNRDIEELLSFACADRATAALDTVLCEMRKFHDPFDFKAEQENELCLTIPSALHPDGNISYIKNGKLFEESFLGLALPFADLQFSKSLTDTRIFSYPIGLATRIMQELLRISPILIVNKIDFSINITWVDIEDKFKHLFCYYKIKQFCDSYSDFDIMDDGSSYKVTLAKNKNAG